MAENNEDDDLFIEDAEDTQADVEELEELEDLELDEYLDEEELEEPADEQFEGFPAAEEAFDAESLVPKQALTSSRLISIRMHPKPRMLLIGPCCWLRSTWIRN